MSQVVTFPTATSFPSAGHLRSLRQSLREASFRWEGITSAQRWEYHAYDYAFLRVMFNLDNHSYPLDPYGAWFNETMVQAAERLYRPPPKPTGWTIPRADVDATVKSFASRSDKAFASEARMTQAEINAAMGVAATEQKPNPTYEDHEALRRGRIELGLEEG